MDQKNMVDITETKIREGKKLLQALDKTELKPKAFFWFFLPEINDYRLFVATEYAKSRTPQEAYKKLFELVGENKSFRNIGPTNITLLPTNHGFLGVFKGVIKTPPDAIASIRFTNSRFNNILVRDALIYRI